eukprot:SAG31_NODE_4900_length_2877_cov_2.136069_5_plen_43_part_00
MKYRKHGVFMGSAKTNDHDVEYTTKIADPQLIAAVCAALRSV